MKNKRYILLDHDGVMVPSQLWGWRHKHPNKFQFDKFDGKAVKVLNHILEVTDAEVIVSSDWRYYQPLEVMQEYYEWVGVNKVPIGYTPVSEYYSSNNLVGRAFEIKDWVSENINEGDTWVAVDDIPMGDSIEHLCGVRNFVHTPRVMEGIKQTNIKEKIIKILLDD